MSNGNNSGSVAIALFSGIAVGVVVSIMFAPKSGEETRKDISEKIDDVKKKVEDVETKGKDFLGKLGEKS
jgi:gas vesicle protein